MESYLYHSLVVGTMNESYLDKGTYESDCSSLYGTSEKQRLVIRCDIGGNINEVITYSPDYVDETCGKISLEASIVASVSLASGTKGNVLLRWIRA